MIYLKEGRTPLNFAYSDEIVHDGNSTYQLSFKFPTNNPLWEELVEETLLLADDLHGEQEFIIFEVEKHHAYITVHANQVATLLNNYSITELSVNNASGDRVMRSLVGSIIREHKFTFSSDIASTHNINLKNVTVATALFKDKHSILGQWGGDLIRDKYDIRLLSNGGTNKEALFMYKKNLKTYQQKKSIKDLRTRIHFTKTISSQKEGEKDKVIAVTVDSPLISKYKNIYEGNLDVSDQDVIDEVTLRKYGEQYFKTTLCDVIEESIEIDVVGNPDVPVNIFDTVTVFHEKFNLDVKKKITKYTYTPTGRKLKTIGFGKIQQGLGTTLASMIDDAVTEHVESKVDAFKIQKNLSELLKLDRKSIEDKLVDLEEKSNSALEVKKALFEADGNIPDVVKTKILDAVEAEVGRLKTIITEAELIKAIQAKLDYAEIKNTLIDKAFINQIISDEQFTQQFEAGEVTTQNIFTKLKDSIKSNISKEFVTKDGVKKIVNDLTIDADGIRQITQQESEKVFEKKKVELKGVSSYLHKKYSDFPDGRNISDNSTLKYIGIYTGDKQQAPTNASEYSWTKIKSDGKLYKAYSNSLNGLDFTLVEPDENAKLFAKNRPRVNIVNNNDISDIWQANMFLSFKPNTKYTLTARAKGNSNKLWAYFRNNKTNAQFNWGQLEFRGLETKSITFTTTNDVEDVLFKFVLVPEDEDWTEIQIDWFTIYEGDKRYTDYPVNEPAQYHKYRYFGYVFKESTPVASDFEWFDLQQTSITNDKYTHIVYSDNADGSNFGREPKKYMGVARTTSPTQPTDKTAYKWFKMKGEDGVSNYIYRKYSDFSNGANMSDNSNLKYIGIYTGTSSTPPTNASAYLWSKIKGEDGANGVPGAKGADGRTPYFHTAYSNSPTGDRDFSTTNSTGKEYIGTYSDFEINDSNDYRRYKWVKIKGENGRDGNNGRDGRNGDSYTRNYLTGTADEKILTAVNDNFTTQEAFRLVDGKAFRDLGFNIGDKVTFIADYEVLPNGTNKKISGLNFEWYDDNRYRFWMNQDLNPTKGTFTRTVTANNDLLDSKRAFLRTDKVNAKIKITNARVIKGDTVQPWSIAQEDLQGHTLTANVRFEGDYINNVTNNVKAYLDVFYDGQKITSGFNAQVKYQGGLRTDWSNFWNANVDNTGQITNLGWGNREQNGTPLEVIVLVTYKDLNTVANARLDNIPDVRLLSETIKKYKTFESTLDGFTSVVGEIDTKVLSKAYFKNNLNSELVEKTGNDLSFNTKENLVANEYYTILADIENAPNNQLTKIYGASDNGDNKVIKNGLNYWVVKYPSNQTRVNLYPLGSSTKVKDVRIYKGDFRVDKKEEEKENLYKGELREDDRGGPWFSLKLKRNLKSTQILTIKFDATGFGVGDKWDIAHRKGYNVTNLTQVLKEKDNTLTFNLTTTDEIFKVLAKDTVIFQYSNVRKTPTLSNIRIYEESIELGYAKTEEVSKLESSIKQAKDEIDLKVSKDNVIAAINASVETTGEGPAQGVVKIDADKVDIRGALRAYKGYIGGFQIGTHEKDSSKYWLTGTNQFYVGMSNGGGNWGQTALWVNWGTEWGSPGNHAWFVKEDGRMFCYNKAEFWSTPKVNGALSVTGNIFYGDDEKNPIGMWVYSPVYKQIYKKDNKWLYLKGIRTGEDWITIDSLASDRRIKTNIKESEIKALDVINKFKTYSFTRDYKEQVKDVQLGIMAQDVKEYMPDAFVENPDGIYSYEPFEMIPYLFKAIQELSQENTNLKSQLNEMNERLTKLEELINGKL